MSKLVTTSHYDARVLVARLGSEGLLAEARETGGAQYPGGPVQVWVLKEDLVRAKALLVTDPLDDDDHSARTRKVTKRFAAALAFGMILMIVWPVARIVLSF